MKAFLMIMAAIYIIRIIYFAFRLSVNEYPVMEENNSLEDVLRLLISIGFGGWALYLFFF